jgi:biopolymer transport protein ExbD
MANTPAKESQMRRERFDKMNVIPFIDIVLVLLVIVLATASFVTNKSIKVDLPSASTKAKEDKKSITIAIDYNGSYYYGKKRVTLKELQEQISKLNPKKDIISLQTDKKTDFHYFVDVIDFMKTKGFENISIVTK